MKYIYNLILLLIIVSSAIKTMESSDNSSCYKSFSREYIHKNFNKGEGKLTLLALTCHEFAKQDIVIKAKEILKNNPEIVKQEYYADNTPVALIERKKEDGCFPVSCAKLLDLMYQTREQLKRQEQQKKREEQIKFEKEYQEMLAELIKK